MTQPDAWEACHEWNPDMPTDLTVIEAAQNLPAGDGLPAVQGVVRGKGCFRIAGKP